MMSLARRPFGVLVFVLVLGSVCAQRSLFTFKASEIVSGWPSSVAIVGDVNRDGHDDLALAGLWNSRQRSSEVQLRSGRDGSVLRRLSSRSALYAGARVAKAGDINRDGYGDLLLGLVNAQTARRQSGRAVVISGRDGKTLFTFDGRMLGSFLGSSVAAGMDVDRDGYPDIALGAPGERKNGKLLGAVYLYSGRSGKLLYRFEGRTIHNPLGAAVELLRDVNRDGYADVLVDARFQAIVYSGKDGKLLYRVDKGFAAARGVGDLDADGATDFVVAQLFAPGLEIRSGKDASLIRRFAPSLRSMSTAIGAGDLDADGIPDIAVGIRQKRSNRFVKPIGPGLVQVYSGKSGKLLWTARGDHDDDLFGDLLAAGGDVNRDGRADLFVAAPTYRPAQRRSYARVLSGKALALTSDGHAISIAAKQVQELHLTAPRRYAGKNYLMLGSLAGIAPGFAFGSVRIALNPDAYLLLTASTPSGFLLQNAFGKLDAKGRAQVRFASRALPRSLAGLRLDHAFVVFDSSGLAYASNPVPLTLRK